MMSTRNLIPIVSKEIAPHKSKVMEKEKVKIHQHINLLIDFVQKLFT